jgi:hypothetical protein
MDDAADHSTVINPRLASHVRWQIRLDLPPLFVIQPKQVAPHPLLCSESPVRSESASDSHSNNFIGFRP